jgi:carbamoyltransferase
MNILGIYISHDTSVCLFQDGKILFYLEEERLSKTKHHMVTQENHVIKSLSKIKEYVDNLDYIIITTFRRYSLNLNGEFNFDEDKHIAESIINDLLKTNIKLDKVILSLEDHHLHHAYNALYHSGFESAVAVVMDGAGSYTNNFIHLIKKLSKPYREVESIYNFKNNKITNLFKHYTTCGSVTLLEDFEYKTMDNEKILLSNALSCGQLFNDISYTLIEKNINCQGKLMGISSYGNLQNTDIEWFKKYDNNYLFKSDFIIDIKNNYDCDSVTFQEKADIAKKLQHETKEYTIKIIQKAIDLSQSNNVVLSGGYFQNCVNNYEYLKAFPHINFYVDPICYDGGTAIGACLYVWHTILDNPNELKTFNNLYLGG